MRIAPFPAGAVSPEDLFAGPESGHRLLSVDDLPPGKSWSTEFREEAKTCRLFLHHGPAGIQAFENRCPHASTPLNLIGDRFANPSGSHFICATHGARFEVESGKCTLGPCKGEFLRPLKIALDGNWIVTA